MKKNRLIALLAVVLCFAVLLPSCKLHRKVETKATEEEEETEDETESETDTSTSALITPLMQVSSLDQFISDGSIFAENVPVPTPTPIPVSQTTLGLTNEDIGYFSGPLENATVVDNEYFRFTIISVEMTDTKYNVKFQFENKSDSPYNINFLNAIMDNESSNWYYYTDSVIEPHTVYDDENDFGIFFEGYSGQVPTRLSFLLLATTTSSNMPRPILWEKDGLNYNFVPVNLFPQGEDAFHYAEPEISDDSSIVYDSDGIQFRIDSFDVDSNTFDIKYTIVNKTNMYVMFSVSDGKITLDQTVFDNAAFNTCYIAPYGNVRSDYQVLLTDLNSAGVDPNMVKTVSFNVRASYLDEDISVLMEAIIKKEVTFG